MKNIHWGIRRRRASCPAENELRVMKLSRSAVEELLWEALLKNGDRALDLVPRKDMAFRMTADETMSELLFYAFRHTDDRAPDFKSMDAFVRENVGITTDSLFEKHKKPYTTVFLPKK